MAFRTILFVTMTLGIGDMDLHVKEWLLFYFISKHKNTGKSTMI